jgi:hypothetical protein
MSFEADEDDRLDYHEQIAGDLCIQVWRYSDYTGDFNDADDEFVVLSEFYGEECILHCPGLASLKKAIKRLEISRNPSAKFFKLSKLEEYAG